MGRVIRAVTLKKGYYLYAIFAEEKPQEFGPIGIGGRWDMVYTLHYGDLAMAVSKTPVTIYDPVRKNAMAHQRVLSAIMQRYSVLPVSFGTCVDSYDKLMDIFAGVYEEAKSALAKIENKIEVGLRVFWKKETFIKEVGVANREVESLKKQIVDQGGGEKAYWQMLELGEKLQMIADAKRQQYVSQLFETLQAIAADAILKDVTSERMIINATFLVDKTREKEFDKAVNKLYNQYLETLEFKYTGPWPPYNFVNIKISGDE